MQLQRSQFDRSIEIDVVKVQHRQKSRISPRTSPEALQIAGSELCAHQLRAQPTRPFVEIADDDPWSRKPKLREDALAQQLAPLIAALKERRAEVHVEEMDGLSGDPDIRT